jgi:hypothetical protein
VAPTARTLDRSRSRHSGGPSTLGTSGITRRTTCSSRTPRCRTRTRTPVVYSSRQHPSSRQRVRSSCRASLASHNHNLFSDQSCYQLVDQCYAVQGFEYVPGYDNAVRLPHLYVPPMLTSVSVVHHLDHEQPGDLDAKCRWPRCGRRYGHRRAPYN